MFRILPLGYNNRIFTWFHICTLAQIHFIHHFRRSRFFSLNISIASDVPYLIVQYPGFQVQTPTEWPFRSRWLKTRLVATFPIYFKSKRFKCSTNSSHSLICILEKLICSLRLKLKGISTQQTGSFVVVICVLLYLLCVCVLCIRENVIFKSCQNIRGNHFNGATCKCIQLARKSSNRNVGFGLESFWLLS